MIINKGKVKRIFYWNAENQINKIRCLNQNQANIFYVWFGSYKNELAISSNLRAYALCVQTRYNYQSNN